MARENVLEAQGLWKSYGSFLGGPQKEALKGLCFRLPQGSRTALIGANGSGKTTAFKCALRLIRKDRGQILIFGQKELIRGIRRQIGFSPERPAFFEELTLREFLFFCASLSAAGANHLRAMKKRALSLADRAGLAGRLQTALRAFSKGMLQKASLIQCFLHKPRLALLDEPFSGLDSEGRKFAEWLFEEMRAREGALIFSSHVLRDIERLCERVIVLKNGAAAFEGPAEKILKPQGMRIAFLKDGKRKALHSLSPAACQREIEKLRGQKAQILSVEPEEAALREIGE